MVANILAWIGVIALMTHIIYSTILKKKYNSHVDILILIVAAICSGVSLLLR